MTPPPPMPAYRTLQASENGESESTPPPQISASLPAEAFSRALASTGPTGVAISAGNPGFHFPPTAPSSAFGTGPVSNNPFATMTTTGAPPLSSDALNPSFGMFSPSIPPTGGGLPVGWHSVAASFATRANDLARRTLAPFQGPGYVGSGASFANQAFHSPVAPGSAPSPSRAGSELGGFVDTGASFGQRQKTTRGASAWGSLEPPNDLSASFETDRAVVVRSPSSFTAAASTWALAGPACCRCPQRASSTFGTPNLSALALMGAGAATRAMKGAPGVSAFASSSNPVTTAGAAQGSFMPSTMIPDRCTTCGGSLPRANVSSEGLNPAGFGGQGEEGWRDLGTGDPPWRATWEEGFEKEGALGGGLLMSLSAMEEYEGKSHEECRLEDYAQNRKNNLVVGLQRREPRGASAAGLHGEHPGLLGQGQAYQSKSHEELRLEDYLKSREECSTDAPSQGSSSSVPEALTTTTPAAKSSLKSAVPPQQKGTEDPAWQPVLMEVKPTISVEVLMSISAIQEYATKSHEELRLEYYLQNRK